MPDTPPLSDPRRAVELGEALCEAARPYVERAAPHEQLFDGEDYRNLQALTAALAAWDALMADRFMAAIEED